jgi:hypothetical protein
LSLNTKIVCTWWIMNLNKLFLYTACGC